MLKNKRTREGQFVLYCIFALVLSILFVLLFSASTSPIFLEYHGGDSAIFEVIGREWANGKIPYLQLFDHKGPYIFLMNAIGYRFGGTYIIQIISLFFVQLGIYSLSIGLNISYKYRFAIMILGFIALFVFYSNGNLTEEYCLPYLTFALSMQISYFVNHYEEHNPLNALFYGITFSICAMTRVTNAVILCAFVFVIFIHLIDNRQWENIIHNILCFIIGFMIVFLPFALYFSRNGAFNDFIYGTFIYNFAYGTSSTSSFLESISLKSLLIAIWDYYILIGMLVCGVIFWHKKERGLSAGLLLATILCIYVCFSGQSYLHYGMILTPCFVFPIATYKFCKNKGILCNIGFYSYLLLMFWGLIWNGYLYEKNYLEEHFACGITEYAPLPYEIYQDIPKEDNDSIIGYNINVSTYLSWDLSPCYTYFHHQDWQGSKSPDLMNKIRNEYVKCKAKWIIAPEGENGISDIIDENYLLHEKYTVDEFTYNVYKLKFTQ